MSRQSEAREVERIERALAVIGKTIGPDSALLYWDCVCRSDYLTDTQYYQVVAMDHELAEKW